MVSLIPSSLATCASGLPVSVTIRTAPSRNSASNFRLFSAMTPNFPCSHGLYATRGRSPAPSPGDARTRNRRRAGPAAGPSAAPVGGPASGPGAGRTARVRRGLRRGGVTWGEDDGNVRPLLRSPPPRRGPGRPGTVTVRRTSAGSPPDLRRISAGPLAVRPTCPGGGRPAGRGFRCATSRGHRNAGVPRTRESVNRDLDVLPITRERVNGTRSEPLRSGPVRSGRVRSGPVRSGPVGWGRAAPPPEESRCRAPRRIRAYALWPVVLPVCLFTGLPVRLSACPPVGGVPAQPPTGPGRLRPIPRAATWRALTSPGRSRLRLGATMPSAATTSPPDRIGTATELAPRLISSTVVA
ncbi:hypothetical protein APS67_005375 [Streptomyces sp. AVP053U2]|nr:hypothetical protein APS67_005375 [Streptomyces sp. AVP053U2]